MTTASALNLFRQRISASLATDRKPVLFHLSHRHRLAEQKALKDVATLSSQCCEFVFIFHSFRHDAKPQAGCHGHCGPDHRQVQPHHE